MRLGIQPARLRQWLLLYDRCSVELPGLQPHRIETFKFSSDPDFDRKLTQIVELYLDPPQRAPVLWVADSGAQIRRWSTAHLCASRTIASTEKSGRCTAPMLMYQHSFSGAFGVGKSQNCESPDCTSVLVPFTWNTRLNG